MLSGRRVLRRVERAGSGSTSSLSESKLRVAGREYDCVVGISGGVDSTYTCHVIARSGLRALAVHLDNGWNSELATHNIEQALKKLGMELFKYVIDWPEFKGLQLAFLRASTPDGELPTYPHFSLSYLAYTLGLKCVRFISPLNYLPYERSEAVRLLREELGWRDYGGKHHESIYTRFFQSYILPRKCGIDKRRAHLSDRIKIGQTTRSEALAELARPPYDPELLEADKICVIKKLGISKAEFASIIAAPRRTFRDFPNQVALIRNLKKLQHWLRRRQIIPK